MARFPTALDISDTPSPSTTKEDLIRLGEVVRHKEHMLTLAENLRKSMEKDFASLSKSNAAQQQQILSYAQLLREKEALIERLESDESARRKELAETGKRLREAETQASMIGKLREDMAHSKAVFQAVETKIKSLEEDRGLLASENKAQKALIDELKRRTKTSDLKGYIERMQAESEETARLFQKTREGHLLLERKVAESEKRNSSVRRAVKLLFDQLREWTASFCQPSTTPVPLLTLAEPWPDLQSSADTYLEMVENTKEIVIKRLQREESEKKDMRIRLEFFEKGTSELKGQILKLGKQVERQEIAGKAAISERETRDNSKELKLIRTKTKLKTLRESHKTLQSEIERFESSVKPMITAAGKLGFRGLQTGISLEAAADCLYFLLAQVDQREKAKAALVQDLAAVQSALAEAQGYKEQAQDLSVQLQSLGVSLGQAEAKVRRSDQLLAQLRELESNCEHLSVQVRGEKERREAASALLDAALQAVVQLKGNYSRLKSLFRLQDRTLWASGKALAAALDQHFPTVPHAISRFRASVIAVMAAKRIQKGVSEGSMDYRFLGLKLVVANAGLDRGFIRELLARATGRFAECLGSLFPKRLGGRNALLALTGQISEKMERLMELSNLKGKEIDIKEEKILRLERNIQDLTQKHSELSQLHHNCPSVPAYSALQQDQEELQSLVFLQQGRLEELERECKEYTAVVERLREAVLELQQQARTAGEQLAEAGKEGRLKDRHIESLEGIVARLERGVTSANV